MTFGMRRLLWESLIVPKKWIRSDGSIHYGISLISDNCQIISIDTGTPSDTGSRQEYPRTTSPISFKSTSNQSEFYRPSIIWNASHRLLTIAAFLGLKQAFDSVERTVLFTIRMYHGGSWIYYYYCTGIPIVAYAYMVNYQVQSKWPATFDKAVPFHNCLASPWIR